MTSISITSFNASGQRYGEGHSFGRNVKIDFIDAILSGGEHKEDDLRRKDIIVVCEQESHMTIQKNIIKGAGRFINLLNAPTYGERGDDIIRELDNELKKDGFTMYQYNEAIGLGKAGRRGLRIAVFAKSKIQCESHSFQPCPNWNASTLNPKEMFSNWNPKGMVSITVGIDPLLPGTKPLMISFTNAHLPFEAANGEDQGLAARMECLELANAIKSKKDGTIKVIDVEFLIGDLNFRTTRNENDPKEDFLMYDPSQDQFGSCQTCGGTNTWKEFPVSYAPTCRLRDGRDQQTISPATFQWAKDGVKRLPSYCDRILYRVNGAHTVQNTGNRRIDTGTISYSDHAVIQLNVVLDTPPLRPEPKDPEYHIDLDDPSTATRDGNGQYRKRVPKTKGAVSDQ